MKEQVPLSPLKTDVSNEAVAIYTLVSCQKALADTGGRKLKQYRWPGSNVMVPKSTGEPPTLQLKPETQESLWTPLLTAHSRPTLNALPSPTEPATDTHPAPATSDPDTRHASPRLRAPRAPSCVRPAAGATFKKS